jgi:hypothetical protein
MNQIDMDRYFWRTGRRWSGNGSLGRKSSRVWKFHGREIVFVGLAFIVTLVGLVLVR